MTQIIDKYIIKEILKNFFICHACMSLLFFLYSITAFLGTSGSEIITFLDCLIVSLIKTIISFGVLIPLSFYFSIFLAFGHFNHTNELVAMVSLSYSKKRFYSIVMTLGLLILFITSIETLSIRPLAYAKLYEIKKDISNRWEFEKLRSEQFYISEDGGEVIFLEKSKGNIENIFIKSTDQDNVELFSSKSGQITENGEDGIHILKMHDTEFLRNYFKNNSIKGSFSEMEIHLSHKVKKHNDTRTKEITTLALSRMTDRSSQAEVQWRICLPLSIIVLLTVCYLIIDIKPRDGKFANLPLAMFYYSTYYVSLGLGKSWVEQDLISNIFIIPIFFFLSISIYHWHKRIV